MRRHPRAGRFRRSLPLRGSCHRERKPPLRTRSVCPSRVGQPAAGRRVPDSHVCFSTRGGPRPVCRPSGEKASAGHRARPAWPGRRQSTGRRVPQLDRRVGLGIVASGGDGAAVGRKCQRPGLILVTGRLPVVVVVCRRQPPATNARLARYQQRSTVGRKYQVLPSPRTGRGNSPAAVRSLSPRSRPDQDRLPSQAREQRSRAGCCRARRRSSCVRLTIGLPGDDPANRCRSCDQRDEHPRY